MKHSITQLAVLLFSILCLFLCLLPSAYAQITPSADAYTNTADPTTNYGAATLLDVDAATQISYIQFNLASIPSGAGVSQATLKLYVNAVTKAGSFNVDYVTGTWTESTITSSMAPALGTAIVSSVSITTADKNQYILINITPAVQAWLNGSVANDGIALVANSTFNASFDSKENTTTSHPAELDVVFAGSGGGITGITTASGSGLMGGGTSGTLNLSLLNTCGTGQVLEWSGSAWVCATSSGSTALSSITSPTANTSIATGTFTTTFTEGDFGSAPVSSAFGITDTATSTTDDSFDLTVENGNNSFHNPFSAGVTESGTYFPQLQICNNGPGHVGASLFGNSVTCGTLSTAPYNKVTITDNTGAHTGLAILNNATDQTGTMLRLLSATSTSGKYNFLTACAGTTAADGLCNGTIVATLTASGALSVATSVTAPQYCIGSNCITSWPDGGNVALNLDSTKVPQLAAANTFTGNQTVNGNLGATGVVTGSSFEIRGNLNGAAGAPPGSLPAAGNGLLLGLESSGYKWVQTYGGPLALNPIGNEVGIGTSTPDTLLTVNGGADKPGGGSWGTFSDGRLKTLNGSFNSGLSQVLLINPVRYRYKVDNAMGIRDAEEHIGVVAQDVQRAIPEAVTENSKGYLLVNNDPIIWAMLNAIKEQQKEIRDLKSELQATRHSLQKVKTQVAASQPTVVASK